MIFSGVSRQQLPKTKRASCLKATLVITRQTIDLPVLRRCGNRISSCIERLNIPDSKFTLICCPHRRTCSTYGVASKDRRTPFLGRFIDDIHRAQLKRTQMVLVHLCRFDEFCGDLGFCRTWSDRVSSMRCGGGAIHFARIARESGDWYRATLLANGQPARPCVPGHAVPRQISRRTAPPRSPLQN